MIEKTNVTLRMDKEVLDKAKKLGINLSNVTEDFLKTVSMEKEEIISPIKLREAYRNVLRKLSKFAEEWETFIKIGSYTSEEIFKDSDGKKTRHSMEFEFYLTPKRTIQKYSPDFDETLSEWKLGDEDWPVNFLDVPEDLIKNLIDSISNSIIINREKFIKLNLLQEVLDKLKTSKDIKKEEKNGK